MKNKRINVGIIAALVIISLFNRYREVQLNRESKIADAIKFNAVDVKLEDILTPPSNETKPELIEYLIEEVPKTR